MVERCGDRQRKFDGLERWPFRLCMESLPIMLQIALLLLVCGLSQSMWSVNTSVARVIISFTVFGVLFYIGIVAAGTSSYECPFQTPASTGLRHLTQRQRDNPEIVGEPISARGHLTHPHHLEGHPAGATPRLRHHAIPIVLADIAVSSDTKPSFYFSGSIERLETRNRDWSKRSEDSGLCYCSQLPLKMYAVSHSYLETVQGCECVYGTWKPF
jgi:hypothetical protein